MNARFYHAPVYRIGQPWPADVRIEQQDHPRHPYVLRDDMALEVPAEMVAHLSGPVDLRGIGVPIVVLPDLCRVLLLAGYACDGPSFPWLVRRLMPAAAALAALAPAFHHDACYQLSRLGVLLPGHRALADWCWRENCRAAEPINAGRGKSRVTRWVSRQWSRWRSWRFWLGVRVGGRRAWRPNSERAKARRNHRERS